MKKQSEIKARQWHVFGQNWPNEIFSLKRFFLEDFINLPGQPSMKKVVLQGDGKR